MCNTTNQSEAFPDEYNIGLGCLYTLIFIGGIIGLILMSTSLKSNMRSVTTVAIINLMVVHMLFILTIPFRIYYYINKVWNLGETFCSVISIMVHAHLYLSFIFYTIILSTRYLTYFKLRNCLEFYRVLHALIASVTIWVIILGSVLPLTISSYKAERTKTTCFNFGVALQKQGVKAVNYILSAIVLAIWPFLASIQMLILWQVKQKHGKASISHQEFWAQIKSLFFVLIMLMCFVPYQIFRIYYVIAYCPDLEKINEVFLAITCFSCFDMLIFAGKDMWRPVYLMCCITSRRTKQ